MEEAPKREGSRKAALAARRGRAVAKDIWSFAHTNHAVRPRRDSRWEVARSISRRAARRAAARRDSAETAP